MIGANFCFSIVHAEQRGQVTNLPIPRFVSMKAPEGNVRRGPSLSHRVDWIFKQKNTPLKIIAEFGHWRQVVDWEGEGGWMHYSLLSGVRNILVIKDLTPLLAKPTIGMPINAFLLVSYNLGKSESIPIFGYLIFLFSLVIGSDTVPVILYTFCSSITSIQDTA